VTTLTFYGGAGEIGGNKILLEAEGRRIFLDFGMSYAEEDRFFEFPLLRPGCPDDLFKTGILPPLSGLYKNAGLSVAYSPDGLPAVCGEEEACGFHGVLLSHAHMDHYGYLGLLHPDIPVYLSPVTRKIIELRNDIREEWQTRVNMDALQTVESSKRFKLGNLGISRFDVDHSVLGASAYIIEAAGKTIAYTGDLRFHGNAREDSEAFLRACRNVDVLLCEGTRVGPPPEDEQEAASHALASEDEVEEKCREILSQESGLVIYDASPADINRMRLICRVAKECGRTLVFDSKKAYFLLYINQPEPLCPGLPAVGDFKIALGRRKLASNSPLSQTLPEDLFAETYTDGRQGHEDKLLIAQRRQLHPKRRAKEGEEEWLQLPDDTFVWGPLRDEILKEPGRYLLYTSSGAHTLLHFFPPDGRALHGTYVYGKAEPFKEEMELSFRRLLNWIGLCGLRMEYAHTSGHMYPEDVERFLGEAQPRLVIPIHTEHPEVFRDWAREARLPTLGEAIHL